MSQVPVQPLLPQHRNECGQKRGQKAHVQEAGGSDDVAGGVLLDGRNNSSFVWDGGVVEGKEDSAKKSCGLSAGIWLKL